MSQMREAVHADEDHDNVGQIEAYRHTTDLLEFWHP